MVLQYNDNIDVYRWKTEPVEEGEVMEELEEAVDGECVEVMRPWVGLRRLEEY